jgi:outer membrane protein X
MKNIFKTAIVVIALALTVGTVNAQSKGDMAAGANVVLGTGDGLSNFGIGAKFQYNILDPLRLEGSFTYFMPKDYGYSLLAEAKLNMWDISVNAHWLFPVADKITVYPLAGLGIVGTSYKASVDMGEWGSYGGSASDSDFGLNLGGGVDFKISQAVALNVEAKYKIGGSWSRLIVSAGVAFQF